MTDVKNWSSTAAENNQPPADGWPEGMARSGVNNAAREMMRALVEFYRNAEWIDPAQTTGQSWSTSKTSDTAVSLSPDNSQDIDISTRYPTGSRVKIQSTASGTFYGFVITAGKVGVHTIVQVALDGDPPAVVPADITSLEIGLLRDSLGKTAYYPTGTTRDEEPPQVPTIDDLGDGVTKDMGEGNEFNADMVDGQHAADIIATASASSGRNSVTNSEFQIWQRGVAFTNSTASGRIYVNSNGEYIADRWRLMSGRAAIDHDDMVDISRDTTDVPTGFWSALKATVTGTHVAANDMFGFVQIMEAREARRFIDSTSVSMSCYLKSNGVTLVNGRFMVFGWTGTADDASGLAADVISDWGTVGDIDGPTPSSNWSKLLDSGQTLIDATWTEYKEENVDFSAVGSVKNIAVLVYADSTIAVGNTFSMTGVQLINGASTPLYAHTDYDSELRRCERFYTNTFDEGVEPRNGAGEFTAMQWYSGNSSGAQNDGPAMQFIYPTRMRLEPTSIKLFNAFRDEDNSWYDQETGNDLLQTALTETITERFVNWTHTGGAYDNKVLRAHVAASAEF